MTKLITADHYAATSQAVEAAIAASIAGETVSIECLKASTRLAVEAELADEADDIRGDVYSGEAWDDAEDAADDDMVRWTVRLSGGADDIVTIEEMPEHLRESHRAAGNWGVYPHNGAKRRRVLRDEAEEIVAADPEGYARIV